MAKKSSAFPGIMVFILISTFFISVNSVFADSVLLKKGVQGEVVTNLQNDLKSLGYFDEECTGYYGDVTATAVLKLQKDYGYTQDGIAGSDTISLIKRLLTSQVSNGLSAVLKKGMQGEGVVALQNDLKALGFFDEECTGYYGDVTEASVKSLQKEYGCMQDGVAGKNTFEIIDRLLGRKKATVSRSGSSEEARHEVDCSQEEVSHEETVDEEVVQKDAGQSNAGQQEYMVPWFNGAENIFAIGKTAVVYDIDTGLSFKIKRTYGYNHADCETLTAEDTKIMKKIFGGSWSWDRRAIIIDVNGRKMAASMAGMPHAGNDRYPANKTISSRSGGYGRGSNLDAVKGNNMDGVFDVHFYKSRTHATNKVESRHQAMVKKATEWAKENYPE